MKGTRQQPSLSSFLCLLYAARISPKRILMMGAEIPCSLISHQFRPHRILNLGSFEYFVDGHRLGQRASCPLPIERASHFTGFSRATTQLSVIHGMPRAAATDVDVRCPSERRAPQSTNPPIHQSPNFIFAVARLAMGGGISYNSPRFVLRSFGVGG